jgi:predicted transcriptional regulator
MTQIANAQTTSQTTPQTATLSITDEQVLAVLRGNGQLTARQILRHIALDLDKSSINRSLYKLTLAPYKLVKIVSDRAQGGAPVWEAIPQE